MTRIINRPADLPLPNNSQNMRLTSLDDRSERMNARLGELDWDHVVEDRKLTRLLKRAKARSHEL